MVKISITDGEIVIRIPMPEDPSLYPLSKSGYTHVVASTHGFMQIEGTDLKVALNVTAPRNRNVTRKPQAPVTSVQPDKEPLTTAMSERLPNNKSLVKLKELLAKREQRS